MEQEKTDRRLEQRKGERDWVDLFRAVYFCLSEF